MKCEKCTKEIVPQIGSIWHNSNNYIVEILDVGVTELWVRYFDNNNRCAWEKEKFFSQYHLIQCNQHDIRRKYE